MLAHDQLLGGGGKGLKFVSKTTISSPVALVDILGLDSSKTYRFILSGLVPAATGSSYLMLQLLLGGTTDNYAFGATAGTGNNAGNFGGYYHTQGAEIRPIGGGNYARFDLIIFDLWTVDGTALVSGIGLGSWVGVQAGVSAFAGRAGVGRVADGIRILSATQNLTAGSITVYEVLK